MGKQQKPKQKVIKERGEANIKPSKKLIEVSHLINKVWQLVETTESALTKRQFIAQYMETLKKADNLRKVGTVRFRSIS